MRMLAVALIVVGLAEGKYSLAAGGALLWYFAPQLARPRAGASGFAAMPGDQFNPISTPAGFTVTPDPIIATFSPAPYGGGG